jgi:hypothetical protein
VCLQELDNSCIWEGSTWGNRPLDSETNDHRKLEERGVKNRTSHLDNLLTVLIFRFVVLHRTACIDKQQVQIEKQLMTEKEGETITNLSTEKKTKRTWDEEWLSTLSKRLRSSRELSWVCSKDPCSGL